VSEDYHEVHVRMLDGEVFHLELSDSQLSELTDAAMYGNDWFRYRDGDSTHFLNLRNATSMLVVPYG